MKYTLALVAVLARITTVAADDDRRSELSLPTGATVYALADNDQDTLPDRLETQLLARFTPYFRFSLDDGEEQYRPMDAYQYVQWSELQTDGDEGEGVIVTNAQLQNVNQLLGLGSDIKEEKRFRDSDRFLNPLKDVPTPGGNWARHGWAWNDVLARRNVGLYGHVVPFRAAAPFTDFLQCGPYTSGRDWVLCQIDSPNPPRDYIKVEYWQFFGYNGVGKAFDFGDHEGDWCTVQVIVDASTLQPIQVHHFAHGYRFGFDLRPRPLTSVVDLEGGRVREYRGTQYGGHIEFWWHDSKVAQDMNDRSANSSQSNVVRMMRDEISGQYDHPVVYVEHGGHEFWPTEAWSFQDSPNHNGDDTAHSYLAAAPPNLGEVEAPLAETPDADVILRYNGRWGAYNRRNSPPQGPALHNGWTWPASSSIRWLLPRDLGN